MKRTSPSNTSHNTGSLRREVGIVEWNYSAVPLSYSSINAIDKQDIPETSTLLDNMIQDISLECNTASSSKKKKTVGTGGKKPRSKSVTISESSTIQTKPTLGNSVEVTQGKGLYGEDLRAFYEKEVKEDEKSKAETDCLLATT
ncbi:17817_t:CDS:2 [Funneliformis geosporum]|uniref:17817_t:CDS:1 n=1 Tax=Funneliformis geosporum TaxID=1117311 RepID=A0A9W4SXF7_9GLOM|nr:17817_t:CDS:2 [Funneliformis geosporum]